MTTAVRRPFCNVQWATMLIPDFLEIFRKPLPRISRYPKVPTVGGLPFVEVMNVSPAISRITFATKQHPALGIARLQTLSTGRHLAHVDRELGFPFSDSRVFQLFELHVMSRVKRNTQKIKHSREREPTTNNLLAGTLQGHTSVPDRILDILVRRAQPLWYGICLWGALGRVLLEYFGMRHRNGQRVSQCDPRSRPKIVAENAQFTLCVYLFTLCVYLGRHELICDEARRHRVLIVF